MDINVDFEGLILILKIFHIQFTVTLDKQSKYVLAEELLTIWMLNKDQTIMKLIAKVRSLIKQLSKTLSQSRGQPLCDP